MKALVARLLLSYFRPLARLQLAKIKPKIVGITGSAGKSSAMEAIAAVLEPAFTIKVGRKANSESGIPLNILGLQPKDFSLTDWLRLALQAPLQLLTNWETYEIYVVEMGIDGPFPPKNMGYLLTILTPDLGVFTSVAPMHSEPFDPLVKATDPDERRAQLVAAIATEKAKMIHALPEDGTAVLNLDDSAVMSASTPTERHLSTFGKSADATIRYKDVIWEEDGTTVVCTDGEQVVSIEVKGALLPEHFGQTFAAALCVGTALGLTITDAARNLSAHFHLPPGRASIISGKNGSTILDSSYNSSAKPTIDTLKLINKLPFKHKIALLGDIRELGSAAKGEHERVAKTAAEILTEVYLVGPQMQEFALPIFEKKSIPAHWFPSAAAAAEAIEKKLNFETLLLVKGSQNTLLLEIAVEKLMAEPERADELLCRRGAFWDAERAKLQTT